LQESYHDIIMIGASAGGIPPMLELLKALPAGLPASLFVVLHRSPEGQDESIVWTLQQSSA
jgi:two-component system chemotaxis response regulator CheB